MLKPCEVGLLILARDISSKFLIVTCAYMNGVNSVIFSGIPPALVEAEQLMQHIIHPVHHSPHHDQISDVSLDHLN